MEAKKPSEGEIVENYVCKAIGCRSRFCKRCAVSLGIKLKERLMRQLATFGELAMLSLTVEPCLFASPREALLYVNKKRAIAKMIERLYNRGELASKRFFVVLEWQKETEMPHWHVLVESDFVTHEKLTEEWGKFRPREMRGVQTKQTGLGFAHVSVKEFAGPGHAASYVGKYLTKVPENGYPQWVIDEKTRIRRYSTSHGFWEGEDENSPEGTEENERNGIEENQKFENFDRALNEYKQEKHLEKLDSMSLTDCVLAYQQRLKDREAAKTTIGQRLALCCEKACIVIVETYESEGKHYYAGSRHLVNLPQSFAVIKESLGYGSWDVDSIPVDAETVVHLKNSECSENEQLAKEASSIWWEGLCKTRADYIRQELNEV